MSDDLRPPGRTTISIRCTNPRIKLPMGRGMVIVDGRRAGFTIAGRDRVLQVLPGVHTVAVRVGLSRSNEVDLTLAPGEQVGLAFLVGWKWPSSPGLVTNLISSYMALLPIAAGLAFVMREPWRWLVLNLLNLTPISQAMLPWVYSVAPTMSSWPMLALIFTLGWLTGLPRVLRRQELSVGGILRGGLSVGNIILEREDRPAIPSPIDLMVADPGPMPSDHLCVQAAIKARASFRGTKPPASRDNAGG